MTPYMLETRSITKQYGGVHALKGVSVRVEPGTVHGLLGENGAGKSTLVRIIAGLTPPTSGEVVFDDQVVHSPDVQAMEQRGVFLVTQEPMIVNSMTVGDNLLLGRWPSQAGWVRQRSALAMATEFLDGTGLDPLAPAGSLSAVDKRKLNILRALHSGGKLIILDEPTTALTLADKAQLFAFMVDLKRTGVAFLFISHYNEEILEIFDSVSVLRDGEMVSSGQTVSHLDSSALSELVIGRGVDLFHRGTSRQIDSSTAWSFQQIEAPGLAIERLDIRRGEILGFAGLPGSGAREFGRAIFGMLPGTRGSFNRDGRSRPLPSDPAVALREGIAFLSEDRLKDGVIAFQSIRENMTLSSLGSISQHGLISDALERNLVARFFGLFAVKAPSPSTPLGSLSGGNQQKVGLSRLIATEPRLIILNEPTRGIDVGIKEEVHRIIDRLTDDGVSVIIITSDLDEMLRVVDRVVLFADGSITGIRPAEGLTKEDVFAAAFSSSPTSLHHAEIPATV